MASVNSADWRAICDKFTTALNLTEVESLQDPENDPFRSKYKAREILREIYSSLKSFEASEGEGESSDGERGEGQAVDGDKEDGGDGDGGGGGRRFFGDSPAALRAARRAAVEYFLGVNHVETEELSAGQEHLMNCTKLLDQLSTSPLNVSLFIHARNQLGILWAGRDETGTAQGYLEMAEVTYLIYMKEEGSPPMDMTEYFSTEENHLTHQERTKRFELAYTHTKYYLAQVYKNLATVVSGLAGEVPSEAPPEESEGERDRRDVLRQKRADIARCWIKYCLNLLQDAKKLLEDNIGELDGDRQEKLRVARRGTEEEVETSRKSALLFGSEDTFDSIASLEEKAKEFFEMDGYVTDHIEILQDHSALFRALAFFEDDLDRRCKMHKRRVDMMEPICNELNAQYYLMIRRQLMFELAETYNEMMDLKLTLANRQADSETLDSHSIKKFNHLCAASAKFFEMFLESLRSPEGKLPELLEEEVLRPALVARFRVARLYGQLICPVISDQLENLNKSLDNYKYVTQYCEAHPEASAAVETELELSQDMVSLLPIKIHRLKATTISNN
ncbi:hypothetical protein NHX12_005770 [Muraenolepis orangiensis]|uniref:KIF-binding protein n=1 Tax=Muraenolepis orangiensis TaxID=630683 RepID=A0A9Q0DUJ1_9TELE|nr:hypothetical protein NHX12_005770 [Muraenolepis orangiensis]